MRTSAWLGMWLVAGSIASCTASHTQPLGAPCVSDDECESAVCGGLEGDRCTTHCEDDDDCTGGWRCVSEMAEPLCACFPTPEYCSGVDDDCDGAIDETGAALCPEGQTCSGGRCLCPDGRPLRRAMTDAVDLLLMIDNSASMAEEHASFARELPRLVQVLSSGDLDDDGNVDFVPVRSLHAAVISSDMGVGGHPLPSCAGGTLGADYGDDGILLTRGRTGVEGCLATYPAIFHFERDAGVDPLRFTDELACVANVGTSGCGMEQQLDSVLKAVSPALPGDGTIAGYEPPSFVDSTRGHADGANAGFVRPHSVLAIVMLTDEEDCSAANPGLFDLSDPAFADADLSLRCFAFPEALHPIERYVAGSDGRAGLLGLRQDPELLVFGLVAGIPTDAVPVAGAAIDYDAILAHPDMIERMDPSIPTRLLPSCSAPGRGLALPPRRMVQVAQGLESGGAHVALGSICQESYGDFTASLVDAIARLGPVACD